MGHSEPDILADFSRDVDPDTSNMDPDPGNCLNPDPIPDPDPVPDPDPSKFLRIYM